MAAHRALATPAIVPRRSLAHMIGRVFGATVAMMASTALAAVPTPFICEPRDQDAMIILDASFSMLRPAGYGMSRFQAARSSIIATLNLLPDDAVVALRLYGSVSQAARMSCTDTVLAVPFGTAKKNRGLMETVLANTHARGVTPIGFTLEAAAGDFTETGFNRTIILVSDGGETCDGSDDHTRDDDSNHGTWQELRGYHDRPSSFMTSASRKIEPATTIELPRRQALSTASPGDSQTSTGMAGASCLAREAMSDGSADRGCDARVITTDDTCGSSLSSIASIFLSRIAAKTSGRGPFSVAR